MRPRLLRLVAAALLVALPGVPATARCTDPAEPPLAELSARALALAHLEPAHVASMQRRARAAALLPRVQVRVGQGTYDYTRNPDTLDASIVSTEGWRFDVAATFSLDHLVFSPHEVRIAEAAGRISEHRVRLLEQVAAAWAGRRALDQPVDVAALSSANERCEQLTVLLTTLAGPLHGISLRDGRRRP